MDEKQLLARVANEANSRGLLWHHCQDSRECSGQPGFPDLLIAGTRGIMIAELKSADGETSADQDQWRWVLSKADLNCSRECERMGNFHQLWRPADLIDGTIGRELGWLA